MQTYTYVWMFVLLSHISTWCTFWGRHRAQEVESSSQSSLPGPQFIRAGVRSFGGSGATWTKTSWLQNSDFCCTGRTFIHSCMHAFSDVRSQVITEDAFEMHVNSRWNGKELFCSHFTRKTFGTSCGPSLWLSHTLYGEADITSTWDINTVTSWALYWASVPQTHSTLR